VNAGKTTSRRQTAGQKHYIKIANKSFKHVANFKYLGTTVQNRIHDETDSRVNLGNVWYHAGQNILSSRLLTTLEYTGIPNVLFTPHHVR
jgi:hypothetical protein